MIFSIIRAIGVLSGKLVGLFYGTKLNYCWYIFRRHYVTQLYQRDFKCFGRKSLLAPELTLIHPGFISVGCNSSIMRGCVLEVYPESHASELAIGNDVSLGEYSHITCAGRVTIGDGVLTGRYVLITDNSHGDCRRETLEIPPLLRDINTKGPVIIEDNVWLGDKVAVLPGVRIGRGAVIGANAVVTKDVPPYAVAAGNPAKIIKQM